MNQPMELSIAEIRKYMQENGCKVTNHALVKHFKRFLTQPATQNEARKQFKTYVNILATIKNENNQKYLILRKKYLTQCPTDEMVERAVVAEANDAAPSSPGGGSIVSESSLASPFRQPPPYKPPPEVTSPKASACIASGSVNEAGISVPSASFSQLLHQCSDGIAGSIDTEEPVVERRLKSISRENSVENSNSKELIPRFSFSSGASATSADSSGGEKVSSSEGDITDNPISVKEATRKFNRLASEEEAKLISPPSKKKVDNQALQEKEAPEVTLAHPKSKEWVVTMAKGNYQELFKLAKDYPELVKLQDPTTGFTALHWAAKHGNEDVVKLIAGRYKADVHARTNGGYTPLHVAMQFGRVNIFELLCNTYKANRDVMDWSGNKPLDYSKQSTSVSPSTYSSEYYDMYLNTDSDFSNSNYHFWPSLADNVGGGGGGATVSGPLTRGKKRTPLGFATVSGGNPVMRTQSLLTSTPRYFQKSTITQSPFSQDDILQPVGSIESSPSRTPNRTVSPDNKAVVSNNNNRESKMTYFKGEVSSKDSYGTLNATRRKPSFLRKTLRAATASATGKQHHGNLTN